MISSLLINDQFASYKDHKGSRLSQLSPMSRINMIVGSNNSGKSRFMRKLAAQNQYEVQLAEFDLTKSNTDLLEVMDGLEALLKSKNLVAADNVTLEKISQLKELPSVLSTTQDNFALWRRTLEEWSEASPFNRFSGTVMMSRYDDGTMHLRVRDLTSRGLKVLEEIPSQSADSSPGRVYIPILRGLRPLDDHHTDFYQKKTLDDYFTDENNAPEIFTGLSFYQRLTDLLLGTNAERKQIVKYQKFVAEELFEGREVVLIPSQKNKSVTIKIGKEVEQPVQHLGDGVQAAIILSFMPFVTEKPTFFFIEEPEAHMHPGLQRKILALFARSPNHTFFLTTHSNHFLDMTMDLRETSVFTFKKNLQHDADDDEQSADVLVEAVSAGNQSSLEQLGVRNSSVFLVNSTIWVEGITDRWYLRSLLASYISSQKPFFKPEEDVHYSFVEYGGSNITHWSFLDREEHPIEVKRLCARAMVIADSDGESKLARKEALEAKLGDRFYLVPGREIENILPPEIIREVIASYERVEPNSLALFQFEDYQNEYLGAFIDENLTNLNRIGGYSSGAGTVTDKVKFCERASEALSKFDFTKLPKSTQDLAKGIYDFIQANNQN